jgi:hypothetical protein
MSVGMVKIGLFSLFKVKQVNMNVLRICWLQLKSRNYPSLDFHCFERAMIIKDNTGDWGIVIGRWENFRRRIPVNRGK